MKTRLAQQLQGPSLGEEEVETPSEHSMASRLSLQARLPLDATITSDEFTHFPTLQLVGLIKASTDQLEHRIQQEEREADFWKQEGLLAETQRMQEEHLKIQAEKKVEKVKEKLTEAWTTFRKTTPQLSRIQCNR
jgi:hypothetical protein